MDTANIVSREQWLEARTALLKKEKEFTKLRDELSAERRQMPWVKIEKPYIFEDADGTVNFSDLFGDKSQLIVYHFMLGPDWEAGCKSCSFWADNFDGIDIHLAHRDITFMAISSAPYEKIITYKERMGWNFKWVSSSPSDFNIDFDVSFTEAQKAENKVTYNYLQQPYMMDEMPGISVFAKDEEGDIFHTYSTYARGLDMLNGAYHYMDLTPKGRDEGDGIMAWLQRHDEY